MDDKEIALHILLKLLDKRMPEKWVYDSSGVVKEYRTILASLSAPPRCDSPGDTER
jgi:hypothetical protein